MKNTPRTLGVNGPAMNCGGSSMCFIVICKHSKVFQCIPII
jgi:hypothetical protein